MAKSLLQLVSDVTGTSVDDVASWTVEDVQTHAPKLLQLLQDHAHSVLVGADEAAADSRDGPIEPEQLEQLVQERIRARDMADTARRAEDVRRSAELQKRVEEITQSRDALQAQRIQLEQRNASLEQVAIGHEAQIAQQRSELEHKSRELAGIVRDASLSVPVRKGNAFEEEFETILRDRVLDISPHFKGYALTRTGGGACAHSGDHVLTVKGRRMLVEEKAYGTKERGNDVPVKEVIKFKSDMLNRKAHLGVMVSKYGRISLGDGSPIDGIKIDGNILYIARMVHQAERMVTNMLFFWTMMLVSRPSTKVRNDAPVAAMAAIVTQYNLLRTHNRDALKANLKLEKVLIDSMSDHIGALAKYTKQHHTRPRGPTGEIGKRMRALADEDTGCAARKQSGDQKLALGNPKRARTTPVSDFAS